MYNLQRPRTSVHVFAKQLCKGTNAVCASHSSLQLNFLICLGLVIGLERTNFSLEKKANNNKKKLTIGKIAAYTQRHQHIQTWL